ncbi:MAG: phospho-sugar mutase [Bacteroidales bacterium]|nr:phospho-sugar mutase [Bacteroidales bacterium]MCF8336500.1 phospho-sugar mutase [Bacteroidales bacterium]
MAVEKYILEKAQSWVEGNYDEDTKQRVKWLLDNDEQELTNAFYQDLEFGTGGLRGVMGVGTNRMNKYTVGMTTQGLANYLLKTYPGETLKVAIAFDCRQNNTFFARTTADVLSANGIEVYLFNDLRPTPELSYAIRHLKCHSGVMITASHNPKEYNGYKVYWNDGGQIVPPHDKNIIAEVQKIQSVDDVKFEGNPELVETIGEEVDTSYINRIKNLSLSPSLIQRQQALKIVYTPLHGTGVKLVPRALQAFGFKNIYHIEEQDVTDGNFPAVRSPNPEEPAALDMAIKKARETDAGLVMATDPDADRVGVAVKNDNGDHVLLNGNQTAAILIYYLLTKWQEQGKLTGREYIAKTVVTTDLLQEIADHFDVPTYNTLTGFKWIADLIREKEEKETFIGGGEESYGYLVGDFVRDKDAVISCAMIAEAAAWAAEKGKSLYQLLPEIYQQFSFYYEKLMSVKREGKEGAEEIQQWMKNYRQQPPQAINGSPIVMIKDYSISEAKNVKENRTEKIDLPQSNVLQFFTEDGSKITMRPSGTEPKIKYYFSVKGKLEDKNDFERKKDELDKKIDSIIKDLKLEK